MENWSLGFKLLGTQSSWEFFFPFNLNTLWWVWPHYEFEIRGILIKKPLQEQFGNQFADVAITDKFFFRSWMLSCEEKKKKQSKYIWFLAGSWASASTAGVEATLSTMVHPHLVSNVTNTTAGDIQPILKSYCSTRTYIAHNLWSVSPCENLQLSILGASVKLNFTQGSFLSFIGLSALLD